MNAFSLALKSLRHRPLPTALNLLLMAVGIAMMTFVLSASEQLKDSALRDVQGIDLVIGAKGSPLQLILSSVYHLDIPTGNIPLETQSMLTRNRMVRKAIPLALGDSYRGFRIVGTTPDYITHYNGAVATGTLFDAPMQAVFGAKAAIGTGVKPGMQFAGAHGLAQGGEQHAEAPFAVVGILKPTGTVLDRLVLTPVESVWQVHEVMHGIDVNDKEEKAAMDAEQELTALLVQYASPLAAATLPRLINSQSGLQAAQPAFESARLFRMLGVGADVLRGVAAFVLLSAGLSLFVALYNALEERRTDLAILRTLGASPAKLFLLLLAEGLMLALAGALLGWAIGHVAVELLGQALARDNSLHLSGGILSPDEMWLLPIAAGVGLLASLLPALRAYRTDIAATLAR